MYVAVLLCSGMWHTQTREFKRVGTEFQTIPFEEIPLDVTQLSLVRNGLQDITFFPNFPVLRKVVLREQPRVTVFPDFENISSSLTDLTMKRCAISYILQGRLQSLVNLQVLDLTNNSLTSPFPDMDPVRGCVLHTLRLQINLLDKFPYLPEIAKTLQILTVARNFNITNAPKETMALYTKLNTLNIKPGGFLKVPDLQLLVVFHQAPHLKIDLSENAISYIDAADLRPLVAKNWTLLLKDNPIKHMGNMLHIAKGKPIDLDGTPVLCDCRMRWLKAAGERETAVSAKGLQCYGPGSVSGSLQETAYEDLVCTGKLRTWVTLVEKSFPNST